MRQATCCRCGKDFASPGLRGPVRRMCQQCSPARAPRTPEERSAHAAHAAAVRWDGKVAKPRFVVRSDDGTTPSRLTCKSKDCRKALHGRRRTYCGEDCRRRDEAQLRAESAKYPRPAECVRCGAPFMQRRTVHLHCSTSCYQRDYLEANPEKRGISGHWKGSTRRKRLPPDWARRRAIVLERDPICKACSAEPSSEVDHIERGDDHDLANLQGLCSPCHKKKTAWEASQARQQRRARARAVLI